MTEIVNLRQARKRKLRADEQRVAEQNRQLHGRTKAEAARDLAQARKLRGFIDGHRREGRSPGDHDE